jgi:hypothetical protein
VHLFIVLFQPTNAQIYITALSLYIMFTATCFDSCVSSSGIFKNLCLAKLHKFLILWLLKLQFHKTEFIVSLDDDQIIFQYILM